MQNWTEIDVLEAMPKERLIDLLRLYSQLLLTIDGIWFATIAKAGGVDAAMKTDAAVWRRFGFLEAKRLKRLLGFESVTTLEDVCKVVLSSPMWVGVGPKAEIHNDRCFLSVTDCHPQKAALRRGLSEFPCKPIGTAYFEGFAPGLHPSLRFNCVFCPPDQHPDDVWCRWEVGWFDDQEAT